MSVTTIVHTFLEKRSFDSHRSNSGRDDAKQNLREFFLN